MVGLREEYRRNRAFANWEGRETYIDYQPNVFTYEPGSGCRNRSHLRSVVPVPFGLSGPLVS